MSRNLSRTHMREQSKLTSIHLFGFMFIELAYCNEIERSISYETHTLFVNLGTNLHALHEILILRTDEGISTVGRVDVKPGSVFLAYRP